MSSSGDTTGVTPLAELLFRKSEECQKEVLLKVIDSLICSICQDYMYVPMMIQCGHNYCYGCLSAWFNSNPEEELSCPHCRGNVVNMPCLNSALQQLLQTVIEASSAGKGDKIDDSKLKKVLDAKKLCEDEYRKDFKGDQLFRGVFRNTAVGIADEEDDGILRCSNCHWELEDDEDDVCPHCNLRIRSRARPARASPSESEEEYDAALEEHLESQYPYLDGSWFEETGRAAYSYAATIASLVRGRTADELLERCYNSEPSPIYRDPHFPLVFVSFSLADGTVVHFPSYILYLSLVNPRKGEREARAISILERLQNVELSQREGAIDDLLSHYSDFIREHVVSPAPFQREVRKYGALATKYETLVREELEKSPSEDYSSPSALSPSGLDEYNYPFLVERKTTKGERLVFPSFSIFVRADPELTENERNRALPLARRLEQAVINRGDFSQMARTTSQDEEYDSVNDFIASDDDGVTDGIADLRTGSGSSEGSTGEGPDSEDPDSDYFEHNEGDGYVSGDSLDDGDHAVRTRPEFSDQDSGQEQDEQDNDEEDDDESSRVRIPRKRNRAIVDISDDDSA
ncbi:hypothetical protein HG536_0H00910 [Torulaspora globosa]|uniref:RING-type domain-containing protein n=1 Tax=Torulaspora globosa TaxID=48254 RepID=A0A7G3ZMI0_9SACH|nr:uncharacterized protein HG536_0H00910 [Torulaspora globosa]QLL34716.1 hypothetical protein HG536_0H00910 [Torulaspora globosa]